MAHAMRKMAVYLGLVEDDHRYQDKYDSYGEYEDYDESVLAEESDDADPRAGSPSRLTSIRHWITRSARRADAPSARISRSRSTECTKVA